MVWRFSRSEGTVGSHSQQNGTAIPRNWSSYLQKYQCIGSWNLEARKEVKIPYTSMEILWIRNPCFKQLVHSVNQISIYAAVTDWCNQFGLTDEEKEQVAIPVDNKNVDHGGTRRSGNVGIWYLETRCNEARASKYWKRRYRWHNYVKKFSSILWQPEIAANFDLMMKTDGENYFSMPRMFKFLILSKNPTFGSCSRRYNYWTSSGSSYCENSWRIRKRKCNSTNLQTQGHISCDIQRNRALCERNSWSQSRSQVK